MKTTSITLIVNYFFNSELKTELKEYKNFFGALNRICELKSEGIQIGKANFGMYKTEDNKLIEMSEAEFEQSLEELL